MKICALSLTCISLLCSAARSETEHAAYFRLLEDARRPYSLNTAKKGEWKAWAGMNTRSGLRLAVNELTRLYESNEYKSDGSALDFAWWMTENTKLPGEDAAEVIVRLGDEYSHNPRRMYFLFRVSEEFGDQDKILKFLAQWLADTRSIELYRAYPDSRELYISTDTRICDAATGSLIVCLSKRGLWQRDSAMKGTQLTIGEKRHLAIDKINQILLEEGIIQFAVSPTDPVPRDRMGRTRDEAGDEARKARKRIPKRAEQPAEDKNHQAGVTLAHWVALLVLTVMLLAVVIWLRKRCR